MKKLLLIIAVSSIAVLSLLPLPAARAGGYSSYDKALVLEHAAEDFPDWKVGFSAAYGSGTWNNELARHVSVGLYQVRDNALVRRVLRVLTNPLWAGEEISWEITDLCPVPLSAAAAERFDKMSPEEAGSVLFDWIEADALPGVAEFMLEEGERWEHFGAFEDNLVGVAEDREGKRRVRIAFREGQGYGPVLSSPAQEISFYLNEIHSDGHELELMIGHGLVYLSCGREAPGISGVNTGRGVWIFDDDAAWDAGNGISWESSNEFYPGLPAFPLSLAELDLSIVPMTNVELLASLDAKGWACVLVSGAEMLDAPDGSPIASCCSRLFGRVAEEEDGWVLLRIGSEEHGMSGWFRREDLAFGSEGVSVPCGFPSYSYEYGRAEYLNGALRGLPAPLAEDDGHLAWLIGTKPDGSWLVLADTDIVCAASPDAFGDTGAPEHYYDPRLPED